MCAKALQLGPTLCDLMDRSPPHSSVHGILRARILEWVAMPSSRGSSQPRDWTHISCSSWTEGGFFTTELLGSVCVCVCACVRVCKLIHIYTVIGVCTYTYICAWISYYVICRGPRSNNILGVVNTPSSQILVSFFFFFNKIFIYLLMYFWLCWVFIAAHGLSLVAVCRLLIAVAFLTVERGVSSCGTQA